MIQRYISIIVVMWVGACADQAPSLPEAPNPTVDEPNSDMSNEVTLESRPLLVSSKPAHLQNNVHPFQMILDADQRLDRVFHVRLVFNEAMNPAFATLGLVQPDGTTTRLDGRWISSMVLTATVNRLPTQYAPLESETSYQLDLSQLQDSGGQTIDLPGQKIAFTTGKEDRLLAHACSHTFLGPFGTVVLGDADASIPWRDGAITHRQYTIEAPKTSIGAWTAHMRTPWHATVPKQRTLVMYTQTPIQVSVRKNDASAILVSADSGEAPYVCEGIAHEIKLSLDAGPEQVYVVSITPKSVGDDTPIARSLKVLLEEF